MNFKEFKSIFDILCMGFALVIPFLETFCVLMNTWLVAYMNPPTYSVVVYVNNYGEAFPELFMWLIFVPICIYGIYLNLQYLVKKIYWHRYHIKKIL